MIIASLLGSDDWLALADLGVDTSNQRSYLRAPAPAGSELSEHEPNAQEATGSPEDKDTL